MGMEGGGVSSMYDSGLKHLLLRNVMANHLPHHPSTPNTIPLSRLSIAISTIRTHHLLHHPSPPTAGPSGSKNPHPFSQAFDEWINRLLALISSSFPENRWAGICFLGITCQECSRQQFLESYSLWFQKLVPHLKPTDVLFVQGATCASLADLITRLGSLVEVTGVRREGTILSGKLIQPLLQLLHEKTSSSIWRNAADLLFAALKNFPSSFKQHFAQVETLLVAKLMKANCDATLSERFASCLALLPRAFGDGATWSSLIRRILLAIHSLLDDALAGMEDGNIAKEAADNLVPRGESARSLGGLSFSANSLDGGLAEFWRCLVPRISSLIQCSSFLLDNPYPTQVHVPLGAILALSNRILFVNGSAYKTSSFIVPVSTVQQVLLCSELPALHSCALDLLYATLCGVRRQLLPRAGDVVRMLTEYFRHCESPGLRIKLYEICKQLLNAMGVGMATAIAPAIISNSLSDLKDTKGTEVGEIKSLIALQMAALQVVQALLTVGGALLSDHWRTEIDLAIASIALNASRGTILSSLSYGRSCLPLGAFKLAAYKAFLASLLSPRAHRPPYLPQALSLFQKGRQETGTDLAEFCAHALLSLEPIIHPRCFSLTTGVVTERGLGSENRSDLKINDLGMHIEVEGDSYVNEIESWINDYGCDQNMVNESNAIIAGTNPIPVTVSGLNEDDQAVDRNKNAIVNAFSVAGLSAGQLAAVDKEHNTDCMVSEDLDNARQKTHYTPLQEDPLTSDQSGKDNLIISSLPSSSKIPNGSTTIASMWTDSSSAVPVSNVYACSMQEESEKRFLSTRPEDAQVSKSICEDGADNTAGNMDVDGGMLGHDLVSPALFSEFAVANCTFSEAGQGPAGSDSDMIPDIVDVDPDTD